MPRSRQVFIGEPGAVLSGATEIAPRFVRLGAHWVASGQWHRDLHRTGQCRGGGSVCTYSNDVYFDDRVLRRVLSSEELRPGTIFFDGEAGQVWIARDPRGHRVEVGRTAQAFKGWGSGAVGVVVQGLVVEKFANQSGVGAIQGREGWIVTANEVRLNHGVGVQAGDVVSRNHIHHNGQLGYSTYGASGTLFAENEVAYNNYADYDWFWEAGGAKFMITTRLTVRGNFVHHNRGVGLATDWDNIHTRYERNRVEDNLGPGIVHEVSYDALISGNVVRRNGHAMRGGFDGAGILVYESANVEVVGNTVVGNLHGVGLFAADREPGKYGAHELRNVFVHDNAIEFGTTISATGLASGELADYMSNGNRFQRNRYKYCQPAAFAWHDGGTGSGYLTRERWVAAGNDTTGSFRRVAGC